MYGNDYNNIAVNAIHAAQYAKAYFADRRELPGAEKDPGLNRILPDNSGISAFATLGPRAT